MPRNCKFYDAPGHLIRRAQQLAVAIFMEETAGCDVTPVQYAILSALIDDPALLHRLRASQTLVKSIDRDADEWDAAYAEVLRAAETPQP